MTRSFLRSSFRFAISYLLANNASPVRDVPMLCNMKGPTPLGTGPFVEGNRRAPRLKGADAITVDQAAAI